MANSANLSKSFETITMLRVLPRLLPFRPEMAVARLKSSSSSPPELPTTCCMSGCANCVWLEYAEELVRFYQAQGENIGLDALLKQVEGHIDDQMVRAFVKLEIKSAFKAKQTQNKQS